MVDKPLTITALWHEYAAIALPPHAGAAQRREVKLAFVGGCLALLSALHAQDFTDVEEGVRQLEALVEEAMRLGEETAER
jgi:hypothetical protein